MLTVALVDRWPRECHHFDLVRLILRLRCLCLSSQSDPMDSRFAADGDLRLKIVVNLIYLKLAFAVDCSEAVHPVGLEAESKQFNYVILNCVTCHFIFKVSSFSIICIIMNSSVKNSTE